MYDEEEEDATQPTAAEVVTWRTEIERTVRGRFPLDPLRNGTGGPALPGMTEEATMAVLSNTALIVQTVYEPCSLRRRSHCAQVAYGYNALHPALRALGQEIARRTARRCVAVVVETYAAGSDACKVNDPASDAVWEAMGGRHTTHALVIFRVGSQRPMGMWSGGGGGGAAVPWLSHLEPIQDRQPLLAARIGGNAYGCYRVQNEVARYNHYTETKLVCFYLAATGLMRSV